jgi:DNA-binding NarL/FixJ family response regulator
MLAAAGNFMNSVYVLDDHDIVRIAVEGLVRACDRLSLVGSASNLVDALQQIRALRPELVITDMSMDDSKGLDTVRAVVQAQQDRAVLVVSMHDEALYAEQALALGARGYLMKENAHASVVAAALDILAGRTWVSPEVHERLVGRLRGKLVRRGGPEEPAPLTARELDVLERLGRGKTTKEIAYELDLSVRTVDIYRANLKRKLGLRTGAELIAYSLSRT